MKLKYVIHVFEPTLEDLKNQVFGDDMSDVDLPDARNSVVGKT